MTKLKRKRNLDKRVCLQCKEPFPPEHTLQKICSDKCRAERTKLYNARQRETYDLREYQREWAKNNPEKIKGYQKKYREKKKKREFFARFG